MIPEPTDLKNFPFSPGKIYDAHGRIVVYRGIHSIGSDYYMLQFYNISGNNEYLMPWYIRHFNNLFDFYIEI